MFLVTRFIIILKDQMRQSNPNVLRGVIHLQIHFPVVVVQEWLSVKDCCVPSILYPVCT